MRMLFLIIVASILLCFTETSVLAYSVPAYDGLVNDYAEILSEQEEQALEQRLQTAALQQPTGYEIAVVTIPSLDGESIEDVALQFFDTWKIGDRNSDAGILLLLAIQDRELRIHTGYGAESVLPDIVADRIIRDSMVPLLKESKYAPAIYAGVDNVLLRIGQPIDQDEETSSELGIPILSRFVAKLGIGAVAQIAVILVLAAISYGAAFLGRTSSWWLGGAIGLLLGITLLGILGALVLGMIGFLLDFILSKNYKQWNLEQKHTSWAKSFGGFHSTGYRSSSSSKSFSFGGGRSGGGGASGKW